MVVGFYFIIIALASNGWISSDNKIISPLFQQ